MDSFDELGVRSKKLGQVIATSPQLLLQRPQEFLQVGNFYSLRVVVSCIAIRDDRFMNTSMLVAFVIFLYF